MQKKQNGMFLIFGILSLLIAGYALFITVFEQIISQNEGFFYTIVFGGILILVYVSINLICRLMTISEDTHKSKAVDIACIIILIIISILYTVWRMSFTITLVPQETVFWQSAELISNNALSVSSDMVKSLCDNPAYFPMSLLYTVLINIPAEPVKIITFVNIFFCCISAIFVYFITKYFTDHLCGMFGAFGCILFPAHMYYVNIYTPDCFFVFLFTLTLFCAVKIIDAKDKSKLIIPIIIYVLTMGIMMFSEPAMIFFAAFFSICLVSSKQNNSKSIMLASFVSIFLFLILILVKSALLDIDVVTTFSSYIKCLNPFDFSHGTDFVNIKDTFNSRISADNYVIEENFGIITSNDGIAVSALTAAWYILFNQIIFMLFAVMCISATISAIQNKDLRSGFIMSSLVASTLAIFMQSPREGLVLYYHCILSIFSSFGLFYIYLNHHPEERFFWTKIYGEEAFEAAEQATEVAVAIQEETEIDKMAFLMRANALIFPGENQNLYSAIKIEERANAIIPHERANSNDDVVGSVSEVVGLSNDVPEIDDVFETVYDAEVIEPRAESRNDEIHEVYVEEVHAEDVSKESPKTAPELEPVTYLHNPLPVPVRKPHVKIDFDFDVDNDKDDWDFDVKDIHLKEFDH